VSIECFFLFLFFHTPNTIYTHSLTRFFFTAYRDKSYITTLREVMTGHVAPTLRSFYHLGVSTANANTAAHARVLSLVPMLCTAHLSLLLVSGANKEDLLIPLEKSANETSFFEEIFLESASRLHSLGFPIEVREFSSQFLILKLVE